MKTSLVAAAESRGERLAWTLAGLCALLFPALYMWGFTVDDALISVRYARNLASGFGYRFDTSAGAPSTDGVTPLPWAFVLLPLAKGTALEVLRRSKVLGIVLVAGAGARLGRVVGSLSGPSFGLSATASDDDGPSEGPAHAAPPGRLVRAGALLSVALAVPVAAHASSGMETAVVIALATFAACAERRIARAALAGLVASFRPEMLPWAVALAVLADVDGTASSSSTSRFRSRGLLALVAVAPFALCVAVRLHVFGHAAPLAVSAKPSDLAHGFPYAGAALLVAVVPVFAFAPVAAARRSGRGLGRALLVAFVVHVIVIVAVGGDWMPYGRLMAPVVPGLALAGLLLPSDPRLRAARLGLALGLGAFLFAKTAPAGRSVYEDRRALIERARPVLDGAKTVAALDIGWVSAATEARIVDLAGLTDPEIAALSGGHTSKRVGPSLLVDRGVDVMLVYVTSGEESALSGQPGRLEGMRAVEGRLLSTELFARRFAARGFLPLGTRGAGYVVYRRIPEVTETTRE